MTGKLAKLRALSGSERYLLLTAALLLPWFWIGMRVLGLPRFQAWLQRTSAIARASRSSDEPATIGFLINVAGNHVPFPTTCLTRSLLLSWLLQRRGVRGELRIGVRMADGRLDAHAWVECEGKPVNDTQDVSVRFAAFAGALSPKSFALP